MRLTQQSEKREKQKAKIRTDIKNWRQRYRDSSEWIYKQQQPEGMCVELEAVNPKGNSRQLFQIVKSITLKFQPPLQCIQCSNWRKFDWTCTNRRQVERVLWRLLPWWGSVRNWTRILGARASTTLFRGCLCNPSDSKLQSHWSWWGPSRTVQSRRKDGTGQNAQNMCGDLGNWVAIGMDVLHIHRTSQVRWS